MSDKGGEISRSSRPPNLHFDLRDKLRGAGIGRSGGSNDPRKST